MTAPLDNAGVHPDQPLLDQLLEMGNSYNQPEPTADDIARNRKLLEVVFDACISKPITESSDSPPTKVQLERAQATLDILKGANASLPEVLLSASSSPDSIAQPVYAWLIPRIISAAAHYEEYPEARSLVDSLCDSCVQVLTVLGRDHAGGEGPGFTRGLQRLASVLRELRKYARGKRATEQMELTEDAPQTLFGFDMPSAPDTVPRLLTLHIVLQIPGPFTCDSELSAAVVLSDIGRTISQLSASRQARYASVVTAAIRALPVRHVLARACATITQWPEIDDDYWQSSVKALIIAVDKHGDEALRRDVWCAINQHSRPVQMDSPVSRQKIIYLLTPCEPHLSTGVVEASLPRHVLQRWSNLTNGREYSEIRERLRPYLDLPPTSSLKRKRQDGAVQQEALELLRAKVPDMAVEGDSVGDFVRALKDLDSRVSSGLIKSTRLICILSQCDEGSHKALPSEVASALLDYGNSIAAEVDFMTILTALAQHADPQSLASAVWAKVLWKAWHAMKSPHRYTRRAGGILISTIYRASIQFDLPQRLGQRRIVNGVLALLKESYAIQETAVLLLGDLGRHANDKDLVDVLVMLIQQLGSKNIPLRSVAYTQLVDIATCRHKQPYNLLSPFLDKLSVLLAESLVPHPEVVGATMDFIGYNRQAFFTLDASRKNVIPALVLRHNRAALETLATILCQRVGAILIEEGPAILAKVFLTPQETDRALDFLILLVNESILNSRSNATTIDKFVLLNIVNLIVTIAVELGDQDPAVLEVATQALTNVQHVVRADGDLGSFLKPHMLGILSIMGEMLLTPRSTVDHKRKILRSVGKLIELVGDSIASFSPQIIASLQSTLEIGPLRLETLKTWFVYIHFLKFADVGPFIGPTIAALVESWSSFDEDERSWATKIIQVISGNASHLKAFEDDIVRFDHIKELAHDSHILLKYRESWTTQTYLSKLIERTDSKNLAVSTASIREVRNLLLAKYSDIMSLVSGNSFDPIVGKLITSLLSAATRDGDCEELKDLAYECFGILGALDPDRFKTVAHETTMPVMSNFSDHEESVTFAIHLIRDLLVGAFRDSNDTKHQKSLALAIQELLKFSGFDSRLVNRYNSVPPKVRQRWEKLPKDVLETVTPLLDAQYQPGQVKKPVFSYPIYSTMKTYREWLQSWTVDLIGRILEVRSEGDARTIFGVFNSDPKNQDVAVAHHLLPHLVLHALLSCDATAREQIRLEINDVLRDQVSPNMESAPEKRMLSAQVIFDLMDHLSKWLRQARLDHDRQSATRSVDRLLSSIDTELTANAAMKSRAFARSLRNFEERIVYLRTAEKRRDADLQTYFESLHEIYAELDEPDGMEGASAFVVSPTLELQIREHESTGRWTAAQSCWEVRLQHSPEDVKFQVGLLKCLQNLGHYDTIRTHVHGVISNMDPREGPDSDMLKELVPFQAEAAWTIGDWATVAQIKNRPPIADVFLAIRDNEGIDEALIRARREIGSTISTREYARAYDAILQLHMLREVEMIHTTDRSISSPRDVQNAGVIMRHQADGLVDTLAKRFDTALPAFRVQEEILNKRRAAFSLMSSNRLRSEQGQAWIQSAKIARKAGYGQTAYSAVLQAQEADAPFAFIQASKLVHQRGDILKALHELEHPVARLIRQSEGVIDLTDNNGVKTDADFRKDRSLAKAVLLEARWSHEADRFEQNDVIARFKKAVQLGHDLESPYFHLGRYYDSLASTTTNLDEIAAYNFHTCQHYLEALQNGVKYIYQTMPRLLTVWLDLSEKPEARKNPNSAAARYVQQITKMMDKRGKIVTYQLLTAFPQVISRITHPHSEVRDVLIRLIYRVIRDYPAQTLWPIVGAIQSKRKDRQAVTETILKKAVNGPNPGDLNLRIRDAKNISTVLLKLAEDRPDAKAREASIASRYAYVKDVFPSTMIMPLQDALTPVLPAPGSPLRHHKAFPVPPVEIFGISDRVEIMPSLQQPKKLVFKGTDGKRYPFLCKPHDDLRKDARLMDFNSMINKFLNSASESRRRHLYIRTYAVMPLNEECGLLEWVSNTNALKSILEKNYARSGRRIYSTEIYQALDGARKGPNPMVDVPHVFKNKVLPLYRPTVFHEWFLTTWPEPTAWLSSRTNYARTLAVMSMIGYVLGLGDRHGENILFDGLTGDTVHVDLNCLFDKAKSLEVPERVPFRLTHNVVDALGVTGVEGVFRKAAEITMDILRSNGDSLMSVLEAFVHDPLVEWTKSSRKGTEKDVRVQGDKHLRPIQKKLRGVIDEVERSVPNQVEYLIRQATSPVNLGLMYVGWAPWL